VDNYVSERCQATGPRLFQEDDGSGCFLGSSTCTGTCLVLADQATCRAQETPTSAPVSTAPSSSPTDAPSAGAVPTKTPIIPIPTKSPIMSNTQLPTKAPIPGQTMPPTVSPTISPTTKPAVTPTSPFPTKVPSNSIGPSKLPTKSPIPGQTMPPTVSPTISPTTKPVVTPTSPTLPFPTKVPSISIGPSVSDVPSNIRFDVPSISPTQKETAKPPFKGSSKKGKGGMMMSNSKKKPDMCKGMGMMMGKGDACIDLGKGGMGKGGMSKGMSNGKGKGGDLGMWELPDLIPSEPTPGPSEDSFGKGKGKGKGGYKKRAWFRSILNATFQSSSEKGSNSSADAAAVWNNASQVVIPTPNTYVDVKVDEDNGAGRRRRIQYHPDR
jgi:hypothetical protein